MNLDEIRPRSSPNNPKRCEYIFQNRAQRGQQCNAMIPDDHKYCESHMRIIKALGLPIT